MTDGPKLPETEVTIAFLEQALQKCFSKDCALLNWTSDPLEGGYTARVLRVHLEWSKKDPEMPETIVVKAASVASIDEVFDKIGHNMNDRDGDRKKMTNEEIALMINRTEYEAYEILSKCPEAAPIPRVYGCEPGVIVMEDMSYRAGLCENLATGFTLDQWKSVALSLADLHAWSLTTNVNWRSKLPNSDQVADLFACYVDVVKKGLKPTIEKYSEYYGHMAESINEKEITYDSFKRNFDMYKSVVPEVLSHGDTWMNNIFFAKDDQGQLTDQVAAFVDWQVASLGCGLSDLVRLAIWSVKQDLRKIHEQEIFELYVDRFRLRAGSKVDNFDISVENLKRVYDHAKAVLSLIGISMTDFMLKNVVKADQNDPDDRRRSEILNRMKLNYDFAAAYFTERYKKGITEL